MRNKLYLLFALLISINAFAQNELVIEFTTDDYPEENSWVLYDLDRNIIKENGLLEKETTYHDTIMLNDKACYFWTLYDEYGEGVNGPNKGDFKLYVDGELFAQCDNPNFGDSISVYNIGNGCTENDLIINKISLLNYISKDELPIEANIVNIGSEPIESIELTCKVNNQILDAQTVSGLNIPVGEFYNISYPTLYNFNSVGEYSVSIEITKVNGSTASQIVNNNLSKTVTVVNGYVKLNMIEDIMSYECGPCYDADIQMKATLSEFDGTQIFLKYMSWPFADKKYFTEIEAINDYYRVMGVPNITLNGERINWSSFTPTYYIDSIGLATPVKITGNAHIIGDSMQISTTIKSIENLPGELVLRGIVIEKECFDVSLSYDNRLPYHNVAYGFVDGFETRVFDKIEIGQDLTVNSTIDIKGYRFEDDSFNDMAVVFYLQDKYSKYIYQSVQIDAGYEYLPLQINSNIENNAVNVDTTGLVVELNANRKIFDAEGNKIIMIQDHLTLRQDGPSGVKVPIVANFDGHSNITIVPEYGWSKNTTYYIEYKDFSTISGAQFSADTLSFTTKAYETGINNGQYSVSVYPNPVANTLYIKGDNIDEIYLYSTSGVQVLKVAEPKETNVLNTAHLKPGVYVVTVKANNNITNYKIIK